MWARAGNAAGHINARALPSWYNIVRVAPVANAPVSLPPAYCGGAEVVVINQPEAGNNSIHVFGNINPAGVPDTIANNLGVQGTAGVEIPHNGIAIFWAIKPQSGFTNDWLPGQWQYRILEH